MGVVAGAGRANGSDWSVLSIAGDGAVAVVAGDGAVAVVAVVAGAGRVGSSDWSRLDAAGGGASAVAAAAGAVAVSRKSIWRAKDSMLSCSCGCAKSLLAMRRTALLRVSACSPEAASNTTCRASDLQSAQALLLQDLLLVYGRAAEDCKSAIEAVAAGSQNMTILIHSRAYCQLFCTAYPSHACGVGFLLS